MGGRWLYLYLVYLLNLLWPALEGPGLSPLAWGVTLLSLLAFLPLYFRAFRIPSLGPVLGLQALGLGASAFNPGAPVYLVYAAAAAGLLPGRRALWGVGFSALGVPLAYALSPLYRGSPGGALLPGAYLAALALASGLLTRSFHRERRAQAELRRLAVVAERERIARDLHDLLGQSLTHLALRAELAARLAATDPAQARAEMAQVAQGAREALALVRAVVRGYRSGLRQELEAARRALEAAGVACSVEGEAPPLSPEAEGAPGPEGSGDQRPAPCGGRAVLDSARCRERPHPPGGGGRWPGAPGSPAGRGGPSDHARAYGCPGGAARGPGWRWGAGGGRPASSPGGGGMIRVLLAEDQALVRAALKALLQLSGEVQVVAEAADGREAVALAVSLRPDLALLDVEMPDMDGLEAARRIRLEAPGVRVVILTTFARPGYLERALAAGALGYLLKEAHPERLLESLKRAMEGRRVVDPELALEALSEPNPLSPREQEALRLAGEGLSAKEVARRLGLSPGTVRNLLSEAYLKLGAKNRLEAWRKAREKGWI